MSHEFISSPKFNSAPEGFVAPNIKLQSTNNPLVLKPTFGSIGSQYVRFELHEVYDASKSDVADIEVKEQIEICLIQNDKFTRCPIRIKDLSPAQRVALAPLYERFKTQKDSKDTAIFDWDAISDLDKTLLASVGVFTVEQLESFKEEEAYKIGPAHKELRAKAARHLKTKRMNDPEWKDREQKEELALLRKEKEELAARLAKLEEDYFAREAAKAKEEESSRSRGRPRKIPIQITEQVKEETL